MMNWQLAGVFAIGVTLVAVGVQADASAFDAAVAADPENAMSIYRRYSFGEIRDTPPPDGYRPFYISHYGRHGSRYLGAVTNCVAADALEKAAGAGILTAKGSELLGRLLKLRSIHEGMYGELSVLGAEEHRRIARRMFERFPQVFSSGGKVRCQASKYTRCIMSMSNFACELKGHAPQLDFSFVTGERYLALLFNFVTRQGALRAKVDSATTRILHEAFDPAPLMVRLFSDVDAAKRIVGDPHAFAESLFYMAAVCRPLSVELDGMRLDDAFTADELPKISRALNGKWYMQIGNSVEFGELVVASVKNLAMDFVDRAEEAINGRGVVADLRFGHDVRVWPLASYIGIEGVGDRMPSDKVCDHAMLWRTMPMASNIQMVFCRNDEGVVIVKVLFNEQEIRLRGLETMGEVYFRWPDLKSRLEQGVIPSGGHCKTTRCMERAKSFKPPFGA